MDVSEIAERLAEIDKGGCPAYMEATIERGCRGGGAGGGGSFAWNMQAEDGHWYVVKYQNNWQEVQARRQQGPDVPQKITTTELVCGRLGQLFAPPICPPVAIISIPDHIAAQCTEPQSQQPIAAGPSFGSRYRDGMVDTKQGGPQPDMSYVAAARIATFQTWLRGDDLAALVSQDGKEACSIDHSYYLTGSFWSDACLSDVNPTNALLVRSPWQVHETTAIADAFRDVLEELLNISEDAIVQQFAGIPPEWGATHEFMAKIAAFVLARRQGVRKAVARLWGGS